MTGNFFGKNYYRKESHYGFPLAYCFIAWIPLLYTGRDERCSSCRGLFPRDPSQTGYRDSGRKAGKSKTGSLHG